ncbi:hypothetical protein AXE80_01060 [Wenyingzhuangia fucanilytica]|uniref:Glycosyl transferase family 1 domain-containing protein n=1 Tax=Wenyingzhuangia fucanilytica TaxID=1790137 RepID=A0A1B1Y2G6_9FLAO|nr:glycosyltransferase [Wenyingzhuangia fucanilytica]ANW94965.1 hypothetical protein AXE80_01060 [Wenyingzhuangia fucanilytica]
MKVCIVFDTLSGYQNKGGAEVQLEKTIEVLKKNNIEVVFYDNSPDTIISCDIVHFFKSLSWYWPIASFCIKHNKPYFVSSIFFITDKYNLVQFYIAKKTKLLGALTVSNIIRLWSNAAYVLPNTTSEESQILNYANARTSIVRNCIDEEYINAAVDKTLLPDKIKILKGNFVLNIGRIEERKNQLRLAIACEKLSIPLVLIGPNNKDNYYDKLMEFDNVIYLGEIWNTSVKKTIINECRLFALPSLLETPGIVAIEAKFLRKKIVITQEGIGTGYFDDYKEIQTINPHSENEIYSAIKNMLVETKESINEVEVPTYEKEIYKIVEFYNKCLNTNI